MLVPLTDPGDPRLAAFRELRDRTLAREGARFVAESAFVVERLLDSAVPVESLLVAERCADTWARRAPPHVPVYVLPEPALQEIVGFPFHRGVLACGLRPASPRLDEVLGGLGPGPATLLVCPDLTIPENLGAIARTAAALGIDAMVLGERCCDPLYRRSIRVSLGAVFHLPLVRSPDLRSDLATLGAAGFERVAAVLAPDAEALPGAGRGPRLALVLGAEGPGLDADVIRGCDRRVTLPMRRGMDSLNVGAAAAVLVYHFVCVAPDPVPVPEAKG